MMRKFSTLPLETQFHGCRIESCRRGRRNKQWSIQATAQRVPKNPKDFGGDVEKIRQHLRDESRDGAGFISGLLNGLGNSAFGSRKNNSGTVSSFVQVLGSVYRRIISTDSSTEPSELGVSSAVLKRQNEERPPTELESELKLFWSERGRSSESENRRAVEATMGLIRRLSESGSIQTLDAGGATDLAAQLDTLSSTLLCDPADAATMGAKLPEVLSLGSAAVAGRMVALKGLLPGADVSRLLQIRPQLLVEDDPAGKLAPQLELLRAYLPGVNVDAMVQEHPHIIDQEIESGLKRFKELWPEELVDRKALAESEHHELVLAIRALSNSGAPKKWAAGGMD